MIALEEIIQLLRPVKVIGSVDRRIDIVRPVNENSFFDERTLTWLSKKNSNLIQGIKAGIVICSAEVDENQLNSQCTYLIVKEPRQSFSLVLNQFFLEKDDPKVISNTAKISEDCKIGTNSSIGHYTVIEKGCIIGDNVNVGSNTIIFKGTIIEDNVTIGGNCSIGGIGFGFEKEPDNQFRRIPHIGNVHIAQNVEIGNNVCVDRAVLGSTYIGRNSKIDNLVHIAHGVRIGENTLIIANAMIAGSTIIGDDVWVAPSSSVMNKVSIGNNSTIGLGAVVTRDVNANTVVVGNPAHPIREKN